MYPQFFLELINTQLHGVTAIILTYLLDVTTHAYCTLLAVKLANINNADEPPTDFPSQDPMEQSKWLNNLASEIIDFIWTAFPTDEVAVACSQQKQGYEIFQGIDDAVEDDGCRCGENTGEHMVRCCNNECGWFHYSCVNLSEAPEEDWWCSSECTAKRSYLYCVCHGKTGKEEHMIQCKLESRCTRNEWYHPDCIGAADILPEKWFCSLACEKLGADELVTDGILEYSNALLYEGLCHIFFRDAIREGDGPTMISHWQINSIQFWNNNHYKYFILTHNMLAGINGFYTSRIAKDMTWNRVANLTGQENGNIGLDLLNEFLNRDYKEMLKRSQGVNTKEQVQRCCQLSGAFGRDLDDIFLGSVGGIKSSTARHQSTKHHSVHVKSPEKFGKKLTHLSKYMDSWKKCVH